MIKFIEPRRKYRVVVPAIMENKAKIFVYMFELQHFSEISEITVKINAKPIDTPKTIGIIFILFREFIFGYI